MATVRTNRLSTPGPRWWQLAADSLKFAALVADLSGLMIHATQGLGYHWHQIFFIYFVLCPVL